MNMVSERNETENLIVLNANPSFNNNFKFFGKSKLPKFSNSNAYKKNKYSIPYDNSLTTIRNLNPIRNPLQSYDRSSPSDIFNKNDVYEDSNSTIKLIPSLNFANLDYSNSNIITISKRKNNNDLIILKSKNLHMSNEKQIIESKLNLLQLNNKTIAYNDNDSKSKSTDLSKSENISDKILQKISFNNLPQLKQVTGIDFNNIIINKNNNNRNTNNKLNTLMVKKENLSSNNNNILQPQSNFNSNIKMTKYKINISSPSSFGIKKVNVLPKIELSPICSYKRGKVLPKIKEIPSPSINSTLGTITTQNRLLAKSSLSSYAVRSREGFIIKKSIKKINQDNYLLLDNILELEDFYIFSIMDGHGLNGHFISEMVKNSLSKYFTKSDLYFIPRNSLNLLTGLNSLKNLISLDEIYSKIIKNNYKLIRNEFDEVENEIKFSTHDIEFSGSTCCLLLLLGDKLICANVGDSRGIMVSEINGVNKIALLSNDHKPDCDYEKERIIKNGGVVKKINEYGVNFGPFRVWTKDGDYPGLAMSRSIGDFLAKSIGVISEPEIIECSISSYSRFIVLASDGIWENLSNEEVEAIVMKYYGKGDVQAAVDNLIQEATKFCLEKERNVDDITVIVVFFNLVLKHEVNCE